METIKLNYSLELPENYTGIVEYSNGTISYYLNGELHRENGAAIIRNDGSEEYCLNDKRHREDGPAVIYSDGTINYYINDKDITKKVNDWIKENNIPEDYKLWTNSDKILFKLTFG